MKTTKIAGIALMLLGIGMIVFTAISYFSREKIVQIGTLEITANQPHYLSWSPFVGMGIMVVGAYIVLQSRKKQ